MVITRNISKLLQTLSTRLLSETCIVEETFVEAAFQRYIATVTKRKKEKEKEKKNRSKGSKH